MTNSENLGPKQVSKATAVHQQPDRPAFGIEEFIVVSHATDQSISVIGTDPCSVFIAPVTAVYAPSVLTSAVGISVKYRLQPGAKVIGMYDTNHPRERPVYIMGQTNGSAIPNLSTYSSALAGVKENDKMCIGVERTMQDNTVMHTNDTLTQALEDNELDISNAFNVGVTLLTFLSRLSAGHLAKVECSLMDEMVRIVSSNFRHHTALGDYKIQTKDGKTTAVWEYTGYEHERMNTLAPGDVKVEKTKSTDTGVKSKESGSNLSEEKLRSRFSMYVGYLGDFVHMWVHDPVSALAKVTTTQAEAVKNGRFHFHVGTDGKLLVQSLSDIAFERVTRMYVPADKVPENIEQAILDSDPAAAINPELLQDWPNSQTESIFTAAYKLREYTTWLNNASSIARLRKSKEHEMKAAPASPALTADAGDPARAANKSVVVLEVYATIRIFRDGMILLRDGMGSAITLAGGDVQVSAPRHLHLQAGGNINLVAGRDVIVRAKQNVEITADTQGIIVRSAKWLKMAVSKGGMLLKCDKHAWDYETKQKDADENDLPDTQYANKHIIRGMVLDAGDASIYMLSKNLFAKVQNKVIATAANLSVRAKSALLDINWTRLAGSLQVESILQVFGNIMTTALGIRSAIRNPSPYAWDPTAASAAIVDFNNSVTAQQAATFDATKFVNMNGVQLYYRSDANYFVKGTSDLPPLTLTMASYTPGTPDAALTTGINSTTTVYDANWKLDALAFRNPKWEQNSPWPGATAEQSVGYENGKLTDISLPAAAAMPSKLPDVKYKPAASICFTRTGEKPDYPQT